MRRTLAGIFERNRRCYGYRNPIGLDRFVVSAGLARGVLGARKIGLGCLGRTLGPTADKPSPLLAVSDHCPIVMALRVD